MKNLISDLTSALRLAITDLAKLSKPAVATTVAAILAPALAAVAGVNVTAPELAGDLVVLGGLAITLQKLTVVKATKPQPAPPAPAPAPPAK